MYTNRKRYIITFFSLLIFIIYTLVVKYVLVEPIGPNGSKVGLAPLNKAVHRLFGTNILWYNITDYVVKITIIIGLLVAVYGIIQGIIRKSAKKIDKDIIWTVIFYFLVIGVYILFEKIIINYRPILIDGELEASYPSSHTMVMLCIMIPLLSLTKKRINNVRCMYIVKVIGIILMVITVVGRLICGVHWLTDIVGSICVSLFLILFYFVILIKVNVK